MCSFKFITNNISALRCESVEVKKREVYYDADLEVGAPAPWGAPKLLVVLHVFAGEVFFNVFVFADEVFDFIGEVV